MYTRACGDGWHSNQWPKGSWNRNRVNATSESRRDPRHRYGFLAGQTAGQTALLLRGRARENDVKEAIGKDKKGPERPPLTRGCLKTAPHPQNHAVPDRRSQRSKRRESTQLRDLLDTVWRSVEFLRRTYRSDG